MSVAQVASTKATPPVLLSSEDVPTGSKWLQFRRDHLRDSQGREFTWDYVNRTTKFRETDGAAVFARVTGKGLAEPHVLLIAQWRPPARTFVVELPAGVISEGETVEEVALRELKEETGYTGRVVSSSPEVHNDQGVCTSCLNLVVADVDADAPENAAPETEHELGETIETLLVPVRGLAARLAALKAERGWGVCSRLYSLALGLQLAGDV
ncbi:MAG: NUDIX hydrolase domain-like protein [Monoraphidium minutum]|nr:MAG: NUDIX hydrolase domain-like protein [Monoraphidium minutum]